MTLIPWAGLPGGAVAIGGPVGVAMGALLTGLLVAMTIALILGAERRPRRLRPAIALEVPANDRAAAA